MTQHEVREEIIECLIIHQPYIKKQLDSLKEAKEVLLLTTNPAFRNDLHEQYGLRIKQWISFYVGDVLTTIPLEFIMIELEKIDLEEYLDV